jgi:heme/copper-type cytochrome/quinol oxidase subunit 2
MLDLFFGRPLKEGNMTIKFVARLIWRFVHAVLTMVGAFFVLYYVLMIILRYRGEDGMPSLGIAWFLVPFLIVAAIYTCVYTWWKRPRENRVTR